MPLTLLALSVVVWAAYFLGLRGGHPSFWNDTYEYAQAARNLAEGKGLTTDAATVLEVGLVERVGFPLPYFLHDPGNSVLMAGAFRLFGSGDGVIGLAAGICFALLAPLTYLLGLRLVGPTAALLAGLLVSVNAQLLIYAGAGYSETPIAFCFTALCCLLLKASSWKWGLAAGLVFGALVLLRTNALPFLPWFVLFLLAPALPNEASGTARRRAVAAVLAFVAGAFCLLGANAVRTRQLTGRGGFVVGGPYLLYHTGALPGKAVDLFSEPPMRIDPWAYALAHPGEIVSKMGYQLSRELRTLLVGGQSPHGDGVSAVLLFLFVFALLAPPRSEDPDRRRFRWLVSALWVTALLVGALFHLRWRHLYVFLPVTILLAAAELARLLDARPQGLRRWAGVATLVVVAAVFGLGPVLDTVGEGGEEVDARDGFYATLGRFLHDNTVEDAIVFLEVPGSRFNPTGNALAWHARRTLLQYSDYTLDSALVRNAHRPVFALRLQLVPQTFEAGVAAERDPAFKGGLAANQGFRPVATFTHRLGSAILYR